MAQELVFNVLVAVIVALIGIITHQLLPYLKQKKDEVTAQIRLTKWAWAADIIDAVVRAVEQTVDENIHGEDKKKVAITYIKAAMKNTGIELTDAQIDTLIEAAVYAMNESAIEE